MQSRLSQVGILALVVWALINYAAITASISQGNAGFGMTFEAPTAGTGHSVVKTVIPSGPADRAGIHPGDTLAFDPSFENLIALTDTDFGDKITVRDGSRTITLLAAADTAPFPYALFISFSLTKFAFLAMATLLILKRPREPAVQAVSLFFAAFGAGIIDYTSISSSPTARLILLVFTQALFMIGGLSFYAFTALFPGRADSGLRRVMLQTLPAVAVLTITIACASLLCGFLLPQNFKAASRIANTSYLVVYLLVIACAITALVQSYRESAGVERTRMRWLVGTFALGFSGIVVLFMAYLLQQTADWYQFFAITIIAMPIGLAYVILRHRMLDITFVVNRAVVYTSVSLIIVGAFIIFEWLLSHVVESNSRASVVIELAGALGLGLSTRYVHARVDRFVDDLFFRDRHLAEQSLRRFAHEATLITHDDVLVKRTVEIAERNARLEGVALYLRRDDQYVALESTFARAPMLDENDEAVLDMRAWHQPIHVRDFHTLAPGEELFPMMVRGQLSGFLACGAKRSHESLAPDERDALRVLARDVGIALDSLRVAKIEAELTRLSSLVTERGGSQPAGAN